MYSSRNISSKLTSIIQKLMHHHNHSKTSYQRLAVIQGAKAAPKGYAPMYVGEEGKRYEVQLKYLSNPAFQELMQGSEEYDLDRKIDGPIKISCSTQFFDQLLELLAKEFKING